MSKCKCNSLVPVESVNGTQYWAVEAASPARAIAAFIKDRAGAYT